jgi:signal transduction histidine kinase
VKSSEGVHYGQALSFRDITERKRLETQLRQAQKLESVGQLAAGIAHEINTPTQYVGDNTRFLDDAFQSLFQVHAKYHEFFVATRAGTVNPALAAEVDAVLAETDCEYLLKEIPKAIQQSLEGSERISKIVRSMKDFAHPGVADKHAADLNKAIESTITVASNEWKYVAEMVTNFDDSLPAVPCLLGEFNQVILNMIVNASHAISEALGEGSLTKGTITISTVRAGEWAEVRVTDTGNGIPAAIQSRIFDPFFTTKEVGKGTGQGLAISHTVVVEKHGGELSFETEDGIGTTFIVRLPLDVPHQAPISGEELTT